MRWTLGATAQRRHQVAAIRNQGRGFIQSNSKSAMNDVDAIARRRHRFMSTSFPTLHPYLSKLLSSTRSVRRAHLL